MLSLTVPTLASFATNMNEVGCVGMDLHLQSFTGLIYSVFRSRIGIATFMIAFALLTGAPITGALLQPPVYSWYNPIVFSGVSFYIFLQDILFAWILSE